MSRKGNSHGIKARSIASTLALFLLLVSGFAPRFAWANGAAQTQSDLDQLKMLSGKDFEIDFMIISSKLVVT